MLTTSFPLAPAVRQNWGIWHWLVFPVRFERAHARKRLILKPANNPCCTIPVVPHGRNIFAGQAFAFSASHRQAGQLWRP
jgi:hypothetical protein